MWFGSSVQRLKHAVDQSILRHRCADDSNFAATPEWKLYGNGEMNVVGRRSKFAT